MKWTKEEIEFLCQNTHLGRWGIAELLDKKVHTVDFQARKYGINLPRIRKIWTPEKIQWLRENYPLYGSRYCAEYLKSSIESVRKQATNHQIKYNAESRPNCRICTQCLIEKGFSDFPKSKNKLGVASECKDCQVIRRKNYYEQNRNAILEQKKEYSRKNQERIRDYQSKIPKEKKREARRRSLPKRKIYMRDRYARDSEYREKILKTVQDYRSNPKNKESIQNTRRKAGKKQRQDPSKRIVFNLRRIMDHVLNGKRKADYSMNMIGCNREELKSYLEKQFKEGMTWENYGRKKGEWVIDHILPCCMFDLSKEEEQRKCFHYTNLRPLWGSENIQKSSEDRKKSFRSNDPQLLS